MFESIRTVDANSPDKSGDCKPNSLYSSILTKSKTQFDQKYLILRNVVLDSSYLLVDIYILMSGNDQKKNKDSLAALQNWHNFTKR